MHDPDRQSSKDELPTSPVLLGRRLAFRRMVASDVDGGWLDWINAAKHRQFLDELLDGEIFCSLNEAKTVIEQWCRHYNVIRPHGSLGWRPPTPEAIIPLDRPITSHYK